jgi:ribonuclease J
LFFKHQNNPLGMPIEICAIGGYKDVGGNCTAIKVDDDVVILDMGLHMENYVKYMEDEDVRDVTANQLIKVKAVPNLGHIDDWKNKVKAVVPSHAHLDHVGAMPFLANQVNAPIVATPFSIEVIKTISKDVKLKNKFIKVNPNSTYKVSDKISVEFIHVTHSTPQSSILAVHTPYGTVLYASDFKFDNSPTLGAKPNYARLKQLKGKVVLLITECLYAGAHQKMPSEAVARQMLKEVMLEMDSTGRAMIVTTFSSHIARLKSIIEFGKKMGRKIVFMGRSLDKYVGAAERVGLVNFSSDIGMIYYGKRAQKELKKIGGQKEKYLLVMTGHQGEPKAMLSRIVDGQFPFPLESGDFVIFSCRTIPSPTTIANRKVLETKLKEVGVRMFTDIHVSGHAAREELRELIEMTEPHHVMPTHGEPSMLAALADLAAELGYPPEKVHMVFNGQRFSVE